MKIVRGILLGVAALIVIFAIFVAMRQNLRFDVPSPELVASTDSAVVERGRYITRALASCAGCHGDPAQDAIARQGGDPPLSGGFVFDIPPGKIYVRNITPDPETGLGNVWDPLESTCRHASLSIL